MLWKTLALSAIVAGATAFGSAPTSAEAGVVVRGSNGFVAVRGPGYRWGRGYGYYGYPAYSYSYPAYSYSYPAYTYSYPSYSSSYYYSQPYYGGGYYGGGYGGYPYYGGRRGAFVGPNGAAFYGPRGGFRIRY